MRRLLTTSPHLATLKLRTQTTRAVKLRRQSWLGNREYEFAELVTSSFTPRLQHADLELSIRSRAEVVAFIQRHNRSFKQLQLYEAGIDFPVATTVASEADRLAMDAGVENLAIRVIEKVGNP